MFGIINSLLEETGAQRYLVTCVRIMQFGRAGTRENDSGFCFVMSLTFLFLKIVILTIFPRKHISRFWGIYLLLDIGSLRWAVAHSCKKKVMGRKHYFCTVLFLPPFLKVGKRLSCTEKNTLLWFMALKWSLAVNKTLLRLGLVLLGLFIKRFHLFFVGRDLIRQ